MSKLQLCGIILISGVTYFFTSGILQENRRMKFLNEIMQAENNILKSEVAELSRKTYSHGVIETILKMKNLDGYGNGVNDILASLNSEESGYLAGYHNSVQDASASSEILRRQHKEELKKSIENAFQEGYNKASMLKPDSKFVKE